MRLISGQHLVFALTICLPFVALLCALIGSTPLSINTLLAGETDSVDLLILTEIRLPRVLLTLIIGGVLAASGAVLQGLFRNPLADPSLIGVSAGASVGASLSIFVGGSTISASFAGLSLVTLGAFIGSIIAVWVVYRLSTGPRGTSVSTMLLVGIAISALAGAMSNLLSFLADNEMLRRMSLWQMGNLDLASWNRVLISAAMLLVFTLLLRRQSTRLNALLLGESEARHLGVDISATKKRLILLAALAVGISTALAGIIAFVGLIVPHLVRQLAGPDHRHLLIASGLMGAILLLLADLIARTILAPSELPVGIVTAFLGVPFFIYLLVHHRRVDA